MSGNKAFGDRIRELREARKRTDPNFSLRKFAKAMARRCGQPFENT